MPGAAALAVVACVGTALASGLGTGPSSGAAALPVVAWVGAIAVRSAVPGRRNIS